MSDEEYVNQYHKVKNIAGKVGLVIGCAIPIGSSTNIYLWLLEIPLSAAFLHYIFSNLTLMYFLHLAENNEQADLLVNESKLKSENRKER